MIDTRLNLKMPPDEQQFIPPEGGWKPHTHYLVAIAMNPNNPIFAGIFFSGFLNGPDKQPQNYSGLIFPVSDSPSHLPMRNYHYFRVIRVLTDASEMNGEVNEVVEDL